MWDWLAYQLREPEKAVTLFFTLIGAVIAGAVKVTCALRDLRRARAMSSIPPTSLPMTASDDRPTREIVVRIDRDDSSFKLLEQELLEERRLRFLQYSDLMDQKQATLKAQAIAEVLRVELADLRRALDSGNTRLHLPAADHVHVVEEYAADQAITPVHGYRFTRGPK